MSTFLLDAILSPEVELVLDRFFRQEAAAIDLSRSLVVVTEHRVRVVGP